MRCNIRVGRMVIFLVLVVGIAGCAGPRHKDRFRWDEIVTSVIKQKETTGDPTFLDVRRVMPFAWESLYVFSPHTPIDHIERTLGFKWGKAKNTRIDERDDITLLVFVTGQTVDEYVEHPRANGDFSMLRAAYPYSRDEAYFEVVVKKDEGKKLFVFEETQRPR